MNDSKLHLAQEFIPLFATLLGGLIAGIWLLSTSVPILGVFILFCYGGFSIVVILAFIEDILEMRKQLKKEVTK